MNYKDYIEEIREWLRNVAEDRTLPMDVKVYNMLWQKIQTIDHDLDTNDLDTKFKEEK